MNLIQALLQYPLILVFFVGNLLIGFLAHMQRQRNCFDDYALASRSLPTGVLVMTLLGTFLSGAYFGMVDRFFSYGLVHIILTVALMVSFFMIGTFIAPRLVYFSEARTTGGLMRTLYGGKAQFFTGVVGFLCCVLMVSTEIGLLGRIGHIVLSIDFSAAVAFLGGLVVLYCVWGGFKSVSYTDILQMVAVLFFFGVMTQKATSRVGGMAKLWRTLRTDFGDKLLIVNSPSFYYKLKSAMFWNLPFSYIFAPPIVHRMLVAKDKREVQRMWYSTAFLFVLIVVSMVLIAFAFMVDAEHFGVDRPKNILPNMVKSLFGDDAMMLSIMFIGMVSVILSTIDSFLHTASIVLVEDIIVPMRRYMGKTSLDPSSKLWYARVGVALVGIFSMVGGLQVDGTLRTMAPKVLIPMVLLYAGVNIPLLLGIVGFKTHPRCWVGFSWGYFGTLGICMLLDWRGGYGVHGYMDYFFVAAPLGTVVYLVIHVYLHGGFVRVKRGKRGMGETLWVPSWEGLVEGVDRWLVDGLSLAGVMRRCPAQPLRLSLLVFALYMLGGVVGGGEGDEGLGGFMAGLHVMGIVLCCGLMLEGVWPRAMRPCFPLYWLGTLFYCLPLGAVVMFLRVHEGTASLLLFVGSFVLLSYVVSSGVFVWMTLGACILGHVGWYVVARSWPANVWGDTYLLSYGVLFVLTICVLSLGGQGARFEK